MPSYQCPNSSSVKYTVNTLRQKLKTDSAFAEFFAEEVKLALGGDQDAIDCVDSYYEPTDSEMQNLGIPSSKWSVMRHCTESGLLVVLLAKEGASQAI
jgi:hypothetical protein